MHTQSENAPRRPHKPKSEDSGRQSPEPGTFDSVRNANQRPLKAITPHPHGGQLDLTLPLAAANCELMAPRLVRIRAR
ncbi:GD15941 [Drosophila simulans]|uniref:GD15941 n=1 Tax=Drosophila simulans TaxID=7240 RepID=B4R3M1_DROSI|nr:GD15941 [Drosophila simulans]